MHTHFVNAMSGCSHSHTAVHCHIPVILWVMCRIQINDDDEGDDDYYYCVSCMLDFVSGDKQIFDWARFIVVLQLHTVRMLAECM